MSLIMSSPPRPFYTPYTPTKPSPLSFSSPISMDTGPFTSSSSAPLFGSSPTQPPKNKSQFKRPFQPNPLMRSSEDQRERRRNQFLQKIRDQREQKTMEMRGGADEMQRTMFLAEKRRREEYQKREALLIDLTTSYEDEMVQDDYMGQMHPDEAALIDEMIALEEQELNTMINEYDHQDSDMAIDDSVSHTASQACPHCASDELFQMNNETICFNCGWSYRT